jgi:GntR family transcriptional regulator / MocR family aminotransferase
MDLLVELTGPGDLVTRLYRGLLGAIRDGRLNAGDRLPASRELAVRLEVSRNTVAAAYERLTAEGFLIGHVGKGTFVAPGATARRSSGPTKATVLRPRPDWTYRLQPTSGEQSRPEFDFRVGIPDGELFPLDIWRRLTAATIGHGQDGRYPSSAGSAGLRAEIARYLGYSRGITATGDDVVLTNGTQHGLDLVARVFLRAGDVVAVEDPGYRPAADLLESYGVKVLGIEVDEAGLRPDALPDNVKLIYTTPTHQFPLGVTMSLPRRRELLDWAARHDSAIFEDDYDSEFRFADRPLQPLHILDSDGRVIYAGTFSKTLVPTLRAGFLVAPASLRPSLIAARQLGDGHGQIQVQSALSLFLAEGHLGRHIRRATAVYAEKRSAILAALRELSDVLTVIDSSAGLHICALVNSTRGSCWKRSIRTASRTAPEPDC